MAKDSIVTPLLIDNVIQAWDEVVTNHAEGKVAAPKGKLHSIETFITRLRPIRHGFREHVQAQSEQIPGYASLKVRLADFWKSPKRGRVL